MHAAVGETTMVVVSVFSDTLNVRVGQFLPFRTGSCYYYNLKKLKYGLLQEPHSVMLSHGNVATDMYVDTGLYEHIHKPNMAPKKTCTLLEYTINEPRYEMVCATSRGSDQPAHTRSLIRAFASRLKML